MNGQSLRLWTARERETAKRIIDAAPYGAVVNVHLPKRTTDQNAKMWAMLSDVSRAKPGGRMHTPDIWKALFMQAAGWAVQFETGLDGRPFPLGYSSSRLDKRQMSDLIEFIYAWGSEHGVAWSESDEARESAA